MKNAVDLDPNAHRAGINMGLKTQTHFRGFLVPSPFQPSSIDTTSTTASQAGPRCGSPKNLTSNDMSLSAFGDQNDFADITIESIRGGTPGDVSNPPMYKFYQTGESTEYGQFGRNAISGFEMVAAETTSNYNDPYFMPLSNGDKLVAYQRQTGSNNKFLLVDKCLNTDTTSTWTNKLTVEIPNSIASSQIICPSMVMMDDGSILVAHIEYDASSNYNISLYRSTDDGEDWDLVSVGALPQKLSALEKFPKKIRMAYSRGQVIFILSYTWFSALETNRNRIIQYLSINGGMSFSLIDESVQTDEYIHQPDLYTDINGDFVFTWIRDPDFVSILSFSDGGSSIIDQIAGNDYHNVVDYSGGGSSSLATCRLVSNTLQNGECTSYELPNGEKHVLSRLRITSSGSTTLATILHFSVDGQLDNFTSATQSRLIYHNDTQTSLVDIHARYVDGRSGLFSSHIANPGPDDNSVHVIYYNSASVVSMPVLTDTGIFTNKFDIQSFGATWFPFDEPHHTGWYTRTSSGAVTDIIQDGEYTITGSNGSKVYYTGIAALDATTTTRFRVKPVLGGSSTSTQRGVELIYDSGSNRYVVEIRIDTNAVDVFDVGGSSSLGNSSGHSSQQLEMLISFTGPNIICWINYDIYRNRKSWVKIVESSVTSITSTGAENVIRWGHITTATSSVTSKWYEFHTAATSFSSIPSLIGYPYPSNGLKQYLNGGCSISTIDGPARIGDKYQIIKQYDHPLERVMFDVNTSPRVRWRSTNTSAQDIVWYTYGNDTVTDVATNNMGAITLIGCNFQSFTLHYEVLGAYSSLGTIDMSDGLVCNLSRSGSTVRSQTSGGGYFYAFENEFAGCMCLLSFGPTNKLRKIISNSAGVMGSPDGKPAAFVLDGIDNTEPVTGTFKVFSNRVTIVHSVLSSSRWKISFPSQDTLEQYFEIGQIIHGSMFVFAPQYGRGRSITYQSNTDIIETPDNQIKTRVRSIGHRTARITWSDPVDQTSLFEASFTGDVYNTLNNTSIYDIANFGDVPYSLMGLYTYLDGAGKPVVYLPSIEAGSTTRKLNRYQDFIYGITTSDISIDHVIGSENEDECFRISQIEIREIT